MTSEEFESLTDMLDTITSEMGLLSDWERGFIEDQVKRVEKYGSETHMSIKQWAMVKKLYKGIAGDETKPTPVGHNGGPDF